MSTDGLLMLAVDQRPWLTEALYGHTGEAAPAQRAAITRGKHVVLDGLLKAKSQLGAEASQAAILVDDLLGPGVAERARAHGVTVSMPIERGGLAEYEDEPADLPAWLNHHQPDLAKVLVRYNPDGDAAANERQLQRLATSARQAKAAGAKFLFELLVPATEEQLRSVGNDEAAYAEQVRPALIQRAMQEIAQRVDVDVWKLEHAGTPEDYRAVVDIAAGHDSVCILLGAGAPEEVVNEWLARAASAGFAGFAIGRSIWWDAVRDLLSGSVTDDHAADAIASRYLGFVQAFRELGAPVDQN